MNRILTAAIRFGERYERPIAIIGGAWFVISCASYMPFVLVPEIPYVTDRNSWVLSGAWNAGWWGFVHPMLERHRAEMAELEDET